MVSQVAFFLRLPPPGTKFARGDLCSDAPLLLRVSFSFPLKLRATRPSSCTGYSYTPHRLPGPEQPVQRALRPTCAACWRPTCAAGAHKLLAPAAQVTRSGCTGYSLRLHRLVAPAAHVGFGYVALRRVVSHKVHLRKNKNFRVPSRRTKFGPMGLINAFIKRV